MDKNLEMVSQGVEALQKISQVAQTLGDQQVKQEKHEKHDSKVKVDITKDGTHVEVIVKEEKKSMVELMLGAAVVGVIIVGVAILALGALGSGLNNTKLRDED